MNATQLKKFLTVGRAVTCLQPVAAYYSGYAGNPEVSFNPGDIGQAAVLDVARVRGKEGSFVCVDFVRDGKEWRVGLDYANIQILPSDQDTVIADELEQLRQQAELSRNLEPEDWQKEIASEFGSVPGDKSTAHASRVPADTDAACATASGGIRANSSAGVGNT